MPAPAPTESTLIITIAVYTWPFLFSGIVGLMIWIWKERVMEKTMLKVNTAITNVRTNLEVVDRDILQRVDLVHREVFGDRANGQPGFRSEMQKVKHGIRALLLMRLQGTEGATGAEDYDIKDLLMELES